jgi:hypothetical protein
LGLLILRELKLFGLLLVELQPWPNKLPALASPRL